MMVVFDSSGPLHFVADCQTKTCLQPVTTNGHLALSTESKKAMIRKLIVTGAAFMMLTSVSEAQERRGIIAHPPVFKADIPNTSNLEVAVYQAEYEPGGINPRHLHPAAITFFVLSGSGVWQEEGKPPVTLKAGDSLFVPSGTIHAHWNPSTTERLRFLEFIVAEKDKGRSIPLPQK
jgi:quercetin dioxygenase-like cupin family protein